MSVASTTAMITDLVTDIGSVLAVGVVSVLGLGAVLIGLFFVWRLIKRVIGRGK